MFIIDKLLFSPVSATIWAARQIQKTMEQERAMEPERITSQLGELYMMLETGSITEEEFQAQEKELLDRLDEIQGQEPSIPEDAETGPETVGQKMDVERSSA